MDREVLVALGMMGVVASAPDPLPGTFPLPVVTVVAVAVQLRRALVVLVVLWEVVLLLRVVEVVVGRG